MGGGVSASVRDRFDNVVKFLLNKGMGGLSDRKFFAADAGTGPVLLRTRKLPICRDLNLRGRCTVRNRKMGGKKLKIFAKSLLYIFQSSS